MTAEFVAWRQDSRALLLGEAVFPFAAQQAYIWLVPHVEERPRAWDVAFGAAVGIVVIVYVLRRGLRGWRTFGLGRWSDQRRAGAWVGGFTLLVAAGLLVWGWQSTTGLRQDWDVLWSLLLYPVWGFVQQGVLFGVSWPRLKVVAPRAAPLLVALLFALAHVPNPLLMIGGGLMVLYYAAVWQRWPALPVLAVSHGVIGAICDKALHVSMRVGPHYLAG